MNVSFTPSRRDLLRAASCAGAVGASGWLAPLASAAASDPRRTKSVILLWMNGGPATIDLWDLKPGHDNGGEFKDTKTTVPGLRISEHLPKLAGRGRDLAVVRSLTSKEGDHGRATVFAKTGYAPVGPIQFPHVGAAVARELVNESLDLPAFVSVAPGRTAAIGGGFLGPKFAPLAIGETATGPGELTVPDLDRAKGVTAAALDDRVELLAGLEKRFETGRASPVVDALQAATAKAVRLMRPEAAAAFELDKEPDRVRDAYGRTLFGQGCLLARRLVERGVPFVEVTLGGWDTHNNNFQQVKPLSAALDAGFAALLADLQSRGLLDSTVVVCMGEFGRTPRINARSGRDHWPASWAAVLAGGGIKGGRAVGKTSADGTTVEETPVKVPDLVATVCKAIGIDPQKQNMSNVGRPIRIADPSAKPIEELL
ncbi:DUF1501 domain-containing protein [Gemmata sp. G18]|uniref:DUF1501 domain-containing protein n=1 Tax=Gemmata palustris TaxID=2822762 RepID=A0ABS5BJ78_9BACT|nr:DUF1501 domain-containing protein [Gemmata palustris]MBP3953744.1 DUF1501 domain-containing protein [Gemmata palustris]